MHDRTRHRHFPYSLDRGRVISALHGVRIENERGHRIDGLAFSILPHRTSLDRGVGARRERKGAGGARGSGTG